MTMSVHFVRDNPKPANAPYREAMVWQKHISRRKPIQLNKNATANKRNIYIHQAIKLIYRFGIFKKRDQRALQRALQRIMKSILPRNAVKNIKSVPSKPLSGSPSAASVSIANIVRGC